MNFPEKLVQLQTENHETNYRLAKAIGVHQSTVQNWRDGRRPLLEHAAKLAAHYGCTIDELMNPSNDEAGKEAVCHAQN